MSMLTPWWLKANSTPIPGPVIPGQQLHTQSGGKNERRSHQRTMETAQRQTQGPLGKLTHDDVQAAEGDAEYLAGKLQERYGLAKEEALKEISEFLDSL